MRSPGSIPATGSVQDQDLVCVDPQVLVEHIVDLLIYGKRADDQEYGKGELEDHQCFA